MKDECIKVVLHNASGYRVDTYGPFCRYDEAKAFAVDLIRDYRGYTVALRASSLEVPDEFLSGV
jgi:hypothetical protein